MTNVQIPKAYILPPEMEASRLAIRKKFLWLMVPAMAPGAFLILPVLRWAVAHGIPGILCVVGELAIVYGIVVLEFRLIQIYIQRVSEKRGFVCPHCHKSLLQPKKKNFGAVEFTGCCPVCKTSVVPNADVTAVGALQGTITKSSNRSRIIKFLTSAVILLGIFLRLEFGGSSNEKLPFAASFAAKKFDQTILAADAEIDRHQHEAMAAYNANDVSQKKLASAYFYRAAALEAKGKHADAENDMGVLIRLKPDEAIFYSLRGLMYVEDGQLERAQNDFQKSASLDPNVDGVFGGEGELDMLRSNYPDAVTELQKAAKQLPSDASIVLWLHNAKYHLRQADTGELAKARDKIAQEWPSSVVDLYLGNATIDAVRAQAKIGEADVAAEQACDADYFIGEYYLENNDHPNAQASLQSAQHSCPGYMSMEKQAAAIEIKAQGFAEAKPMDPLPN